MEASPIFYLPGQPGAAPSPLARFLPPLPVGMVSALAHLHLSPGSWILDPLGASPQMALETARSGCRVLVVSNNPITSFILEVLASAPQPADFQSALAALGSARRDNQRLEMHFAELYQTECSSCGEIVTAQSYLWRRGEAAPYARIYRCPHCGDEGERPLTPADLERLTPPGNPSLHRARALQRVAIEEDEHYSAVQEALDAYLPRPLYVLTTLINKQEGLSLSPFQRKLVQALLISACDAASTLWPWPGGRARPRQLTVPPQFRENNLWLAMEQSAAEWASQAKPVPFTRWPELPPAEGGICLYPGRLKALLPLPETLTPAAVWTVFPRPNQAFWTLSAMWSGWLWGREASLPLHSVLGRRRFDWSWHTGAMQAVLSTLRKALPEGSSMIGLLPEVVPGFLAAVTVGAALSGFELQGLALRSDDELIQALWKTTPAPRSPAQNAEKIFEEAAVTCLEALREPSTYLPVYTAGLLALARQGALPFNAAPPHPPGQAPIPMITALQALTARAFANRKVLRRFSSGSQEDERSLWWLASPQPGAAPPLTDRVEMEVVRYVQKNPTASSLEIDSAVCRALPGPLTPPNELVRAVLESYCVEVQGQPGHWRLLPQETPTSRRADLEEMQRLLVEIGTRMGYTVSGETPLVWTPRERGQVYFFYILASGLISKHVLGEPPGPVRQCVLVFPGGRARLLSYKLRRDPRLAEAVSGWHMLKFRHLRELAARFDLNAALWDDLLDTDPPFFEEAVQMQLL